MRHYSKVRRNFASKTTSDFLHFMCPEVWRHRLTKHLRPFIADDVPDLPRLLLRLTLEVDELSENLAIYESLRLVFIISNSADFYRV